MSFSSTGSSQMSSDPPTQRSSSPSLVSEDDPNVSKVLSSVVKNLMQDAMFTGKKKRPAEDQEDKENEDSDAHSYMSYGRDYARQGDIFTSTDDIVQEGIKLSLADSDCDTNYTDEERRNHDSWSLLCKIIPNFRDSMLALSKQRAIRKRACKQIDKGMHAVRAEDTNGLTNAIVTYLLVDSTKAIDPPFPTTSGRRSGRGLHHPITAALICPLKYPATQQTYDDILAGKKSLTAEMLPRFLYPDGQEYNPDDIDEGILQGHLMLRVAKHMLQGPSAALERPGYHRGKQGNAALMGITSVTPRMIAYIAVQTRFAISSQAHWSLIDGKFDYRSFFWFIVGLFDNGECQEILDLYNYQVFGESKNKEHQEGEDVGESDFARWKAQRAAKKARLAAAATV